MPIIHIHAFEGRTVEQKRRLVEGITRATVEAYACPPEAVQIVIHDTPRTDMAVAGILASDQEAGKKG
ncbi:MAG: 4-oxalocrotonate tautomerase [Azospirillum brasilense]|nr:MAG: 4-oxalocrotonate tautomerase [Azospirillum brasilense]